MPCASLERSRLPRLYDVQTQQDAAAMYGELLDDQGCVQFAGPIEALDNFDDISRRCLQGVERLGERLELRRWRRAVLARV